MIIHNQIEIILVILSVSSDRLIINLPRHFKCPEQSDAPQHGHPQGRHDLLAHQDELHDGTYHNYEIKSESIL